MIRHQGGWIYVTKNEQKMVPRMFTTLAFSVVKLAGVTPPCWAPESVAHVKPQQGQPLQSMNTYSKLSNHLLLWCRTPIDCP